MARLSTALRFAPLLAAALGWVMLVRLGLSLTGHARLRDALLPGVAGSRGQDTPARIVWAVRRAAQVVPGASCLTQALAAQVMLARRGWASALVIGVDRGGDAFAAHAWLEIDGRPVLGGTDASLAGHARLARFPAPAA